MICFVLFCLKLFALACRFGRFFFSLAEFVVVVLGLINLNYNCLLFIL